MSDLLNAVADDWPKVRYQAEAGGWNLPLLTKVWIDPAGSIPQHVEPNALGSIEQQAFTAAKNNRGWLRYRSDSYDGERWARDGKDCGPLLWAEWVDEAGSTSHRLAPDGTGCVVHRIYRESGKPLDGWIVALAQDVMLQGYGAGRDLAYHVYWGGRADDPSAIRRLFARFVGFTAG